jgi:hypothetical protein
MAINTLRAAELLSDDSNFRAGLIPLLAPTSAHLLALGEQAVTHTTHMYASVCALTAHNW